MKKYHFDVSYTAKTTMAVIADSEELALREVNKRFLSSTDTSTVLTAAKNIQWMAQRCDTEIGEWYNDEYEQIESNHEHIGPFDSVEEALNAIRTQWGYGGNFTKSYDQSYTSTDSSRNGTKDYTVYAREVD